MERVVCTKIAFKLWTYFLKLCYGVYSEACTIVQYDSSVPREPPWDFFLVGQRNFVYYYDQDDDLADITMDTGRRERKHWNTGIANGSAKGQNIQS